MPTLNDLVATESDLRRLESALVFIRDLATEEYEYAKVGTGAEVVLRKIIQRANNALGE